MNDSFQAKSTRAALVRRTIPPWILCLALVFAAAPPRTARAGDNCDSSNPADWPSAAKPYLMIIADTSGSMQLAVGTPTSCGLPDTRNGHLRCGLRHAFNTYANQVNLGLSTYAVVQAGCAGACFNCTYSCFQAELNTTGLCAGCGPRTGNASTRSGAFIRVGVPIDSSPPPPSNQADLLQWTDNSCANQNELFYTGNTPLNGSLRDMYRYYSNQWAHPDNGTIVFTSPLRSTANGERGCRSVNVLLITDGDETCDTQADAVQAAAALYTGFTRMGITWRVKVYVINLIAASQSNMDQIAAAGGTISAYFAVNSAQIAAAIDDIVDQILVDEVCGDGVDNNCNGCTDESTVTANAGSDTNICPNVLTSFTATPGGGTGPYTYAWTTTGGTLTQANQQTAQFSAGSGLYQLCVTVTDSRQCEREDCVTVLVNDTTSPSITCPSGFTVSCVSNIPAAATTLLQFQAQGGSASDNCSGVNFLQPQTGPLIGGGCGGTVTRTYQVTDASLNPNQCTQVFTVDDDTQPTISCPTGSTVSCVADIPPAATSLASFELLGGSASDNCGTVFVSHVGDSALIGGGCGGAVTRTYRATDPCNNETLCTQVFTVDDDTQPTISCPAGSTVSCVADIPAAANDLVSFELLGGSARDNCGTVFVAHVGDGALTGGGCGGAVTRTYRATDPCNNETLCTQVFTVDNNTNPTFDAHCPLEDIVATSTDPSCTMLVNIPTPTATGHCGMAVATVTSARDDGQLLTDPFPVGTTTVTWTATDACNNAATCLQNVVISGTAPMYVSLALAGSGWPASLTRCIQFELYQCPGASPVVVNHDITFSDGAAMGVLVPIPCGTTASCITVRDRLHSLRRLVDNPTLDMQGRYVVDCTGADSLVCGNLNDDRHIDILDYGAWAGRYLVQYDSNGDTVTDGHTPCSPPPPTRHADVNGNGEVFTEDFTFLQINFFRSGDANCCDLPGFGDAMPDDPGPRESIAVTEMIARGMFIEAAGDVDGDGVLSIDDIAAIMGGQYPVLPAPPADRADSDTAP